MYAVPHRRATHRQARDPHGATVAGTGRPDAAPGAGLAARRAAHHRRHLLTLPHLAHRGHATPRRTFGRRSRGEPKAWPRAALLPECDSAAGHLSAVVLSPPGTLGGREAPPPASVRGER